MSTTAAIGQLQPISPSTRDVMDRLGRLEGAILDRFKEQEAQMRHLTTSIIAARSTLDALEERIAAIQSKMEPNW